MSTFLKTEKTRPVHKTGAKSRFIAVKLPSLNVTAQPCIEPLEPRLVFDASFDAANDAPGVIALDGLDHAGTAATARNEMMAQAALPLSQPQEPTRQEIIFIDGSLSNTDALKASTPAGAEVHMLTTGQDGLRQMAEILAGRSGIDAIHILSHGAAGELQLGSAHLTTTSAQGEHRAALESIGRSLSAHADILVYGCDVVADSQGRALARTIGALTGADVAASEDRTGASEHDGDWDLEFVSGVIDTGALRAESWNGVLSLTNTGNWTVAGTTATNTTAGVTSTINFAIGAGGAVSLNTAPQTLNTTAAFFANSAEADPSLGFTYTWDTTPESATGIPQPNAGTDDVPMTVTITFSTAITNPIIHIDRLGGSGTYDPNTSVSGDENVRSNSSLWTLNTPGATLTKLAGVNHLEVTSNTFQRTPNAVMSATGLSGEASTSAATHTAAASMRVNGTFTSLTFTVTGVGVEGAGADGIEIALTVDAPPTAIDETAVTPEDTVLTGNVLTNDTDPQGDTLSVKSFTVAGLGGSFTPGSTATIPGVGTLVIAANGAYTFTPALNYSGPVPAVDYVVRDASGGTDTGRLTLSVTPINDAPVAVNDTRTMIEDGTLAVNTAGGLLSNDSDIEGQALTITGFTVPGVAGPVTAGQTAVIPGVGSLTINADGSYSFVPLANYSGPVPVATYTVRDAGGASSTATLTISITPVNDPIVAASESATTVEDTSVSGNVLSNDSDVDDPLTVTAFTVNGIAGTFTAGQTATIPGVGQLTINANGSYTFVPAAHYHGPVPVASYTISDGKGGTASATLSLSVTPVNDPGVFGGLGDNTGNMAGTDALVKESDLASGTSPTNTGETATGTFTIADVDGIASLTVGGVTMTLAQLTATSPGAPIVVSSPTYGSLAITGFNPATGAVTYAYTLDTTAPNLNGVPLLESIPLTLTDGQGNTTPGTLGIAILDDAPVATNDVDRVISKPGNPSSIAAGNVVTGAPSATDPNTSDGFADVAGADGFAAQPVNGVVAGTGTPQPSNVGAPVAGLYGSLTLNPDGSYVYTPTYSNPAVLALGPNASLNDVFTYRIVDADGSVSTATLTLSIAGTPAIINAGSANPAGVDGIAEESDLASGTTPGETGETIAGSFSAVVTAPDTITTVSIAGTPYTPAQLTAATALTPIVITTPVGVLNITGFDPATGSVNYTYTLTTPQDHTSGPVFDNVPVSVTSNLGDSASGNLRFEVKDDAPLAINDLDTVSENGTQAATGNVFTGIDPAVGDTNASDGAADKLGADVQINPVTQVGAGTASPTTAPGLPVAGLYGSLTLNPDGTYSYQPNRNSPVVNGLTTGESLSDVFTYEITDNDGDKVTATLTISILGVNDPVVMVNPLNPGVAGAPVPAADPLNVIPDIVSTDSATPTQVNVADYIRDPEGKSVTYGATGLPPGLSINPATGLIDGVLTRDASQGGPNNDGIYPVTVTITDDAGNVTTTTVNYTVTNPPPVATDNTGSGLEEQPISGNLLTDGTADSDPDGDPLTVVGFTVDGLPGTFTPGQTATIPGIGTLLVTAAGTYTFTPEPNFNGAVPNITYTVSDGHGGTDTANLSLSVTPVNDPPVASDNSNTTPEDAPVSGNVIMDGTPDTDVDNDALQLTQFTVPGVAGVFTPGQAAMIPGVGQIIMHVNGSYTFTPALNFTGSVPSVTYTVSDGNGGTDTAVLSINVGPVNDAPVATDNAKTVTEDQPATGNLLTDGTPDSDIDNDPLTVTGFRINGVPGPLAAGQTATIPGIGQLTINGDGSYVFTPAADYHGPVPAVTYTISDGKGGEDSAVLTLTVTPAEDPGVIGGLGNAAGTLAGTDAVVKESDLAAGTSPTGTAESADGTFTIADIDGIASLTVGGVTITLTQLTAATPGAPIVVPSPTYGALAITGFNPETGAVSYAYTLDTRAPNVNGVALAESIALVLTDALGNTTPGTLGIAILDDAPVAANDVDRVLSRPGNPSSIAAGNVVTGAPSAVDPNTSDGTLDAPGADGLAAQPVNGVVAGTGTPLASGVGAPVAGFYGSLTLNADGSYVYTPDYANPAVAALGANAALADVFTYRIVDADGSTSTATLTLSITGTPAIINAGSASAAAVDGVVEESDLAAGSTPGETGETITGSFTAVVASPDTIATVSIAGTSYTPAQLTTATPANPILITTPVGVLSVTGFDSATGNVSYSYALTTPQDHAPGAVFDTIPLSVTSNLGDTATGNLRFEVKDDAPVAMNDTDTVDENGTMPATGNVYTGIDPTGGDSNATDGTSDTIGADTRANPVTQVGAGTADPATAPGQPVTGLYGTLTLNADGSYSYQPNRNQPEVNGLTVGNSLTDVFTYQITDADGDKVTATLSISILGANDPVVMVNPLNPGVPGAPVPAVDPLNVIPDIVTVDSLNPPAVLVSDYMRDPEGKSVTYGATGLPPGLSINSETGLIDGALTLDASQGGPNSDGIYPVTVTITDDAGNVTTTTITYTITNPLPLAVDDTKLVTEDVAATGNLLANDGDPDGDPLTVTGFTVPGLAGTFLPGATATIPGVGSLAIAADGTWIFTPAPNYEGAIPPVTYTIADKDGASATAVLTLTMQPVNDRPVVIDPANPGTVLNPVEAPDPANIIPDVTQVDGATPAAINVADFFRDPEGKPLTYDAVGLPAGLSIDPATGLITGTLARDTSQGGPNDDGVYPVTITVTDDVGNKTTTTITYTVSNPPPVAVDDSATTDEDRPVSGNLLTGGTPDSDPDGDPLAVTGFTVPGLTGVFLPGDTAAIPDVGSLLINADGSFTFTPAQNYNGAVPPVTYTIADKDGATDEAVLTIAVIPVNDRPVVVDPANPGTSLNPAEAIDPQNIIPDVVQVDSATPTAINLADYIRDPEGNPLRYAAVGLPPGLMIDPATGLITGTLTKDASQGGPDNDGVYPVTITVTDPDGLSTTTTINYTVTNPPPVATDDNTVVTEDTPATGDLLLNDRDPDSDALRVTGFTVPGLPATFQPGDTAVLPGVGALTINADGTWSFTPAPNYDGPIPSVTYTIVDKDGATDEAVLALVMQPVNDRPVVIDPANPGTPLNPVEATDPANIIPDVVQVDSATPIVVNVADYIRDPEGRPLTYDATGLPPGLVIDPATGLITGTLAGNASQGGPDNNGVYPVTITVTDSGGLTTTTTLNYTISNPPPSAVDDAAAVTEDVPATGNLLINDSDPDGDPLTVTGFTVPGLAGTFLPGATATIPGVGALTIAADGTWIFTPAPNYNGAIPPVTYTMADRDGALATAVLTLTMQPVNDAPFAQDDSQLAREDGAPVLGSVLTGTGADSDVDGDSLSVVGATWNGQSVIIGQPFTLPNGALLTLNADGTYSFDPRGAYDALPAGQMALEAIQYVIEDGDGAQATATLTLTIEGVNDAPRLVDPADPANPDPDPLALITQRVALDSSRVVINAGDVFRDPDGRPLAFRAAGLPPGLFIDPVTGVISGIIGADASQGGPNGDGVYPIKLTILDPDGGMREVTLPFSALNPPPVATDNQTRIDAPNTPVTIDVLPNDNDPDGDILTIMEATSANGEVTITPDGKIRFNPARGFSGRAEIAYIIADGHGGFARAIITVDVPPEDSHVDQGRALPPLDVPDRRASGSGISDVTRYYVLDALRRDVTVNDILASFREDAEKSLNRNMMNFDARSFLGSSVAGVSTDAPTGEKLWVEGMMHERQFVLKVWQEDENGRRSTVDYRLISDSDLRWLEQMGRDIHAGVPPVEQESVEVDIEARMASGETVMRVLVIEPRLGQVRMLERELTE